MGPADNETGEIGLSFSPQIEPLIAVAEPVFAPCHLLHIPLPRQNKPVLIDNAFNRVHNMVYACLTMIYQ